MPMASAVTKPAQIRVARRSPAYWRVTINNPPINVMGPEMVAVSGSHGGSRGLRSAAENRDVRPGAVRSDDGAIPALGGQSVVVDVRISAAMTHINR